MTAYSSSCARRKLEFGAPPMLDEAGLLKNRVPAISPRPLWLLHLGRWLTGSPKPSRISAAG